MLAHPAHTLGTIVQNLRIIIAVCTDQGRKKTKNNKKNQKPNKTPPPLQEIAFQILL